MYGFEREIDYDLPEPRELSDSEIDKRTKEIRDYFESDIFGFIETIKMFGKDAMYSFRWEYEVRLHDGEYVEDFDYEEDNVCYYLSLGKEDIKHLAECYKEYAKDDATGNAEEYLNVIACLIDNYAEYVDKDFTQIAEDFKAGNVDKYLQIETIEKPDIKKGKTDIDR